MSLTALAFLAIYTTGIILTFRNPVYGVMTYIFEWHNHPAYFWWGDALPDLRWSYTIALVTLVSWLINKSKLPKHEQPDYKPLIWLGLLVANTFMVSTALALLPDESFRKSIEWFKILVNYVLMIQLIREYKDYRLLVWVLILSTAHMGWISFQDGSNRDIGVIAPNATEENALSAHIIAMLPFFGTYFLTSGRIGKLITVLGMPFCLNLLILANSRGAILGLAAIAVMVVFLVKGKIRMAVIGGIIASTILFFSLTNEQFFERQSTTTQYEQEGSAMSRIYLWRGAFKMFKDYPLGVGGEAFVELSMDYVPEILEPKSQHNTLIAILTDWGFFGLIFYLGFLIHTVIISFKVRKNAMRFPELSKYYLEVTALQLSLLGVTVAGIFHSRQYSETVYWICAFIVAIYNIQQDELFALHQEEEHTEEIQNMQIARS